MLEDMRDVEQLIVLVKYGGESKVPAVSSGAVLTVIARVSQLLADISPASRTLLTHN